MKYYKMDTVWQDMNKIKLFKTKSKRFKFLPKLAEVESVIPHSNAEPESVFNIARKNKNNSRYSLKLDGTLSSVLAINSKYQECVRPCHRFQLSSNMIKSVKSATAKALNNRN